MVAPMALPSIRLAGNAHRPRLPNHDHLDLSRVLDLALDLARDLVRQACRRGVIDGLGRHDDADFAARLDREHPVYALELGRQRFELAEPFHVRLERLAPGARPRSRNRVRRLHDAGVHVSLRLLHDLFDATGVDAAVGDQALERQAADLTAHRLEAGYDDGVGRVVDDDVDAGGGLECADVAALAADDPAFHFV